MIRIQYALGIFACSGLLLLMLMLASGSFASADATETSNPVKSMVDDSEPATAPDQTSAAQLQVTELKPDATADAASKENKESTQKVSEINSQQIVKHPQAKSVELDEPVITPASMLQDNVVAPVVELAPAAEPQTSSPADDISQIKPLVILDTEVLPSTSTRLSWSPSQSFEGIATPTPILIVHGAEPGPVLCLTAAIHGDELNGIEIVRSTLYDLEPDKLAGTVIGVPIVNLQGFRRSSRYLTDRRDLNRYFPGNPGGSSASRIAHSFFTELITHCDALVDLHTGSFHRTNLPQLRADVTNPKVVELTQGFGSTVVLQSEGATGTLRRAAVDAGIPAVTLEAGESMRLQADAVSHGVKGIQTLMSKMGMIDKFSFWGDPEPVYYNSVWVRASHGGILFSDVELGDKIDSDDLLGVVTDPITNIKTEIRSPNDGRVIGMALNQVVLPGFAAFHIGIRAPEEVIPEPENIEPLPPESIGDQVDLSEADGAPELAVNGTPVDAEANGVKVDTSSTEVPANPVESIVEPEEIEDDDEGMEGIEPDVDQYD